MWDKGKSGYAKLFVLLLTIIAIIFTFALSCSTMTYASTVTQYEQSGILDDLKGATIGGKVFNEKDYPANALADPQLLSFVEYGYSETDKGDYNLFIYVYNPRGYKIQIQSNSHNRIQLAFGTGEPANYKKYAITCLDSVNDGLLLKYKIELTSEQKQTVLARLYSGARVYKISGIELLTAGEYTATEYPVEATCTYTGYAKGYGTASADSTLECKMDGLETVALDVEHTYYRTKTSAAGNDYQVQIDTVYFSVPRTLIEKYDRLQRIKAEWYEYKTKEMAVTNNKTVYDTLKEYIGVPVGQTYNKDAYYGFMDGVQAGILSKTDETGGTVYRFDGGKIYNSYVMGGSGLLPTKVLFTDPNTSIIDTLYYLFYTDVDQIMSYDPFGDVTEQGGVESNKVYDYIKEYSNKQSVSSARLPVKDGRISADLFESDIDASRKTDNERGKIQKGYSYYDFDVDEDWQTLRTYQPESNSFQSNANMYGFWNALIHNYKDVECVRALPPIQILTENDLKGTTDAERQAISDKLCINYKDVAGLQSYYNEVRKDSTVVLFRFATTDYYSAATEITMDKWPGLFADKAIDGQAYIAQGTCFFDFDIIQLSFKKGDELYAIPVVMSPQDFITEITPPVHMPSAKADLYADWWKYALTFSCVLVAVLIGVTYVEKRIKKGEKK